MTKILETLYTPEDIIEKITIYDCETNEIMGVFKNRKQAEEFIKKNIKHTYYKIEFKEKK